MSTPEGHTCSQQACKVFKRSVLQTLTRGLSDVDRIYGSTFSKAYFISCPRRLNDEFVAKSSCQEVLKRFKTFTSGLLDALNEGKGRTHPLWEGTPRRMRKRETQSDQTRIRSRLVCASALVSLKKLLPKPSPCLTCEIESKTLALLSDESRTLPEDYLDHCRNVMFQIFGKRGGGGRRIRGYMDYVNSSVLSLGACMGSSRKAGGNKGLSLWSREEWIALHSNVESFEKFSGDTERRPLVEYQLVVDSGKGRGITMNEGNHQVLRPLHSMLYDGISSQKWLLRGEATKDRFHEFGKVERGGLFVSGDYTSATDNLTIDVAEVLLHEAFKYIDVPTQIREFAIRSLRTTIIGSNGELWEHKRGQLMGSLLSFPLLCLQNYCAFRWYVPANEVPDRLLRINGDDIVFYVKNRAVYERWANGVRELGLELSPGKTFVHRCFFSLNSTYFWFSPGSRSRIVELPVVRFGLLKLCRGGEVGKNFNSFVRPVVGQFRSGAIQTFYRRHRKVLRRGRVSLCRQFPEGLGMKILSSELEDLGLLKKELDWFSRKAAGVPLVPKLNNFEVSPDYKFEFVEHQLDEADRNRQVELFIDWHWSTDLKIGNSKERDFQYESNFASRVMFAGPYEKVYNLGGEEDAREVFSLNKAYKYTGVRLIGRGNTDMCKTLLSKEQARIASEIDKAFFSECDSTERRQRILVKKNRLRTAMETSVDFSSLEPLDLAVEVGSSRYARAVVTGAGAALRRLVAFESDGAEEQIDISRLLVKAYQWKWNGRNDGESGH